MFNKYQNKLYIGGNKSDVIWQNINALTNEKKLKFVSSLY